MTVLHFGDFRIDTSNKRLWRGDAEVDLKGMPFAVLCHLVERGNTHSGGDSGGRLISKTEIQRAVWRDVHVSDETIRGCISQIRRALGDDAQQPRYIKTHNKEGWRWLAAITPEQTLLSGDRRTPQPPDSPYDPLWYVERPQEEREILGCVGYPGRPVVLYGPQGSGKRTLISRALARAGAHQPSPEASRVIRVSLRSFTDSHLSSLDSMLYELGMRILDPEQEEVDRMRDMSAGPWAKKLDPQLKLKRLLKSSLLVDSRVVYLVLADIDALVPWRHQATFFDMLRAWQDAEGMNALRLIMSSAIAPRLFPLSEHSPLWTKSARIQVAGFTEDQVAQLARLYGLAPSRETCRELIEIVGGLPSLCRQAVFRAAVRGTSLEAVLKESLLSNYQSGCFSEHLSDLEQWLELRSNDGARPQKPWLRLLRESREGVTLSNEDAWPLVRKGLLRETERRGVYRLRCKLYEEFCTRQSS